MLEQVQQLWYNTTRCRTEQSPRTHLIRLVPSPLWIFLNCGVPPRTRIAVQDSKCYRSAPHVSIINLTKHDTTTSTSTDKRPVLTATSGVCWRSSYRYATSIKSKSSATRDRQPKQGTCTIRRRRYSLVDAENMAMTVTKLIKITTSKWRWQFLFWCHTIINLYHFRLFAGFDFLHIHTSNDVMRGEGLDL